MSPSSPTQFDFSIDRFRKLQRSAPPSKFESNYLASLASQAIMSVRRLTRRLLLAFRESRITDH